MAADGRRSTARSALQVAPWRGSDDTVVLSPMPDRPRPQRGQIVEKLEVLAARGIRHVHTSALHRDELAPFFEAGFRVQERLHLLRHDLTHIPVSSGAVRLRRTWRRDHEAIVSIDVRAFDEFWTMDRKGLADAMAATPISRFRVATVDGTVAGYAITGRASSRGYIQRLAVAPDLQRGGVGSALVCDGLRWLSRARAGSAVVNTQEGNDAALALYLTIGFTREPYGLTVATIDLPAST